MRRKVLIYKHMWSNIDDYANNNTASNEERPYFSNLNESYTSFT